jgi:hypothetical protein
VKSGSDSLDGEPAFFIDGCLNWSGHRLKELLLSFGILLLYSIR